jgi:hypothetical protein
MNLKRARSVIFWFIMLAAFLFGLNWLLTQPTGPDSSSLVINELMVTNNTGLTDEDGDYSDWIELYNRSNQPVNLSGWSLSDDPQQPQKWPFPNLSLGSGQYLVVFASGKDRRPTTPGAELHANFKLNRNGEFLGLYNVLENRLMDSLSPQYPAQLPDISYGRAGESHPFQFLANPTPGQPNDASQAWTDRAAPVSFSRPRGFYQQPFNLELKADPPAALIRYTTDGSVPTAVYGLVYSQPIPIERTTFIRAAAFASGLLPSPVNTHSYIFLKDVLAQPDKPPGFPGTWGQHTVDYNGHTIGEPVEADYEMDPEIVNHPDYGPMLPAALTALPSLSLVTEANNFMIYANPRMKGQNWERPVSMEWLDPTGQSQDFQINAGIRIQGGASRWEFIPKHSFRLFFRDAYGAAALNQPMFEDSPLTTFDTLILRAGSDRSYAGHPENDQHLTTYTRDQWLRDSQIAMAGFGSHGRFVHLYLNGLYWGLYNLVERPEESFMSAYFGGDPADWFIVNHSGPISGADDRFEEMMRLAEAGGLADPKKYLAFQSYLDVTRFADYLVLEWYAGNTDWPQNNWFAAVHNPAGQVRFLAWDGEMTWVDGAKLHTGQTNAVGLRNTIKPLFEALIENPDFKLLLADRLYKHLFNDGALTDAQARARWQALSQVAEPTIVAESARWGDTRYQSPITPDDWRQANQAVLAQMEGNAAKLIAQARQLGYYPAIDPPEFNFPGGLVEPNFELTLSLLASRSQNEGIYYTTDGSNPRQPGSGAVAPTAKLYTGPITLTETTTLKARALAGRTWSALAEAEFAMTPLSEGRLTLTEIMYNPMGGNDFEFIELQNIGQGEVNLAGLTFDEGISFTFPPGTLPLPPGRRVVLVRNPSAFAERYPGVVIAGEFQGKLANQGEKLTMRDPAGMEHISFSFDDENGWPISPDGQGDSLVLVNPLADPANPQNWRASRYINGSPGAADDK